MKKYLKYIIVLFIILFILLFIKITAPEPIDWSPSFSKNDKIPFGDFILYDILPELFPGKKITAVNTPVYNLLEDNYYSNTNYIFINQEFMPEHLDLEYLLDYVSEGNNIFISAFYFTEEFLDTLKLKVNTSFSFMDSSGVNLVDSVLILGGSYNFHRDLGGACFTEYDTSFAVVLGKTRNGKANYIVLPFGNGRIYLNSFPFVFTNYNLLEQEGSEYILKALSYLPVCNTFWDEYYKAGNVNSDTPLRFILSEEPLRLAYYLLIVSLVIYVIFRGKRDQRIIPLIKPLANTTAGFVKNIGQLYYEQKDHKNIAEKKISYFLDFIRGRYFIKKNELNEETFIKLSEKSGIDIISLRKLFNLITRISAYRTIREEELVMLNFRIEKFYKQSGYYGRKK